MSQYIWTKSSFWQYAFELDESSFEEGHNSIKCGTQSSIAVKKPSQTFGIQPTQDTFIDTSENNNDADPKLGVDGSNLSTLLQFDLRAPGFPIGPDAVIESAVLNLFVFESTVPDPANLKIGVFPLLKEWKASYTTKTKRLSDALWAAVGLKKDVDYDSEISIETILTSKSLKSMISFDITNLAIRWLDPKKINNGVLVRTTDETAVPINRAYYFCSTFPSICGDGVHQAPSLVITYH